MITEHYTRILVFGLPGSGKTTFSKKLLENLNKEKIYYAYFNADEIRTMFNDWDFSINGRIRQSNRMFQLCELSKHGAIADFICPYEEMRKRFNYFIWMNTIQQSKYEDTNKVFQKPKNIQPDIEINDFNYEDKVKNLVIKIKNRKSKFIDTRLF